MGKGVGGGIFSREYELTMLPDGRLKLFADFFRRLVRRIESITPVADPKSTEIIVRDNEAGQKGRIIKLNAKTKELTICENGAPKTIIVYVKEQEE